MLTWFDRVRNCLKEADDLLVAARDMSQHYPCCTSGDCCRPQVARGLCAHHYKQWRKQECIDRGVKRLREIIKVSLVSENQLPLFTEPAEPSLVQGPLEQGPLDQPLEIQF
jgi:hypothetical protein